MGSACTPTTGTPTASPLHSDAPYTRPLPRESGRKSPSVSAWFEVELAENGAPYELITALLVRAPSQVGCNNCSCAQHLSGAGEKQLPLQGVPAVKTSKIVRSRFHHSKFSPVGKLRCWGIGAAAASCLLATCGGGTAADKAAPTVSMSTVGVALPRGSNDLPVLLTPGTARHQYLAALFKQLDLVRHPPRNVVVAGTIVSSSISGLHIRIPSIHDGMTLVTLPTVAPGSTVFVAIVTSTKFLVAHGDASLAPGSPILVLAHTDSGRMSAVLVTDLSGVRGGTHVARLATLSGHQAMLATPSLVSGGREAPSYADEARLDSSIASLGPNELVASGSWGWDGVNAGINGVQWGNKDGCPYFGLTAQVVAGFGAEWHFSMHLLLTPSGNLKAQTDPANGSGVVSGTGTQGHTFYSSFGAAADFDLQLSCKIPIPSVTIFGHTFGGGSIGPSFDIGAGKSFILENETDSPTPLWNSPTLDVPAVGCFDLSSDEIPGIGNILETIHGPAIDVPVCADMGLQPAGMRLTALDGSGGEHGVSMGSGSSSYIGFTPTGSGVRVDNFNFTPVLAVHLTAAIMLGRPTSSSGKHTDEAPPLATAKCGDGSYSFSQSAQGTCSHHGGVESKLDPSSPAASPPDSLWSDLVSGRISAGPWTVPFVSLSPTLQTTWNVDSLLLPVEGGGGRDYRGSQVRAVGRWLGRTRPPKPIPSADQ